MKILFISRAFPPITGGIENQNAALAEWLPKHATVLTLANRGGKGALPWFLPFVLFRSLWLLRRYDAVLLGDGVLAPIGFLLKLVWRTKIVASVVHGLDLTFANKPGFLPLLYKTINIPCLKKLDLIISVSRETASVAQTLGIPKERCLVINNGVDPATLAGSYTRDDLSRFLGIDLSHKFVIVRIGRYVKHKGNEWFIRNVMPLLPDDVLLVTAGARVKNGTPGDSDSYQECQTAVTELHLAKRVQLLSDLPWENIKLLHHTADMVIAPNIDIPGTMEGFGISVIESSFCGRPVIASNLQGLKDAIIHHENGLLVTPGDALAWSGAITPLIRDAGALHALGIRAAQYTRDHYHWNTISKQYITALTSLSHHTSP